MRSLFFDDRCFHGRHRCRSLGPYYSARTAGTPSSRVRTEISCSNGLNGDFSDRYLWVKEKQENALEYLNLSACFIHIVFLAFLVVSARKRSK